MARNLAGATETSDKDLAKYPSSKGKGNGLLRWKLPNLITPPLYDTQLTGSQWMCTRATGEGACEESKKDDSPFPEWLEMTTCPKTGGGWLMDVPGLGKTFTALYNILQSAKQEREKYADCADHTYKASFIACPSGPVCDQWIKVITQDFPGLRLILARGSRRPQIDREDRSVDPKIDWLTPTQTRNGPSAIGFPAGDLMDSKNPDTLNTVVLCTYEAWRKRILDFAPSNDPADCNDPKKPVWFKKTSKNVWPSKAVAKAEKARKARGEPLRAEDEDSAEVSGDEDGKIYVRFHSHEWSGVFGKCYYNEGHRLRQATIQTHWAMRVLEADVHHFLTATPMMNSAIDIAAQLRLLWAAA
jgi:hypothetical protein